MDLDTRLQKVAVVGAAGKMGSGISLLLARELAWRALAQPAQIYTLALIDVSPAALQGLKRYLRTQAVREAEKRINRLRELFRDREDLVENGEMIEAFADQVMALVDTGTSLSLATGAHLVFEAAFEREDLKIDIYRQLAALCGPEAFFLTNTSSIPLHVLESGAGITGRLIGYHFYNPPAVQRLLEVVTPDACQAELRDLALELATVLGKQVVVARDIAGFIGNGHFMRDGLQGLRSAESLAGEVGFPMAVLAVDAATRTGLVRPMGIFQLMDYVGIDVCQLILRVMESYLQQGLHHPWVDQLMEAGVRGGQTSSGAQKDGFFRYEKGRITGVYDLGTGTYQNVDNEALARLLGPWPEVPPAWKALQGDPRMGDRLAAWFRSLDGSASLGARLALDHGRASRETARRLVADGVAARPEDVDLVLTLGFFHLTGPFHPSLDGGVA